MDTDKYHEYCTGGFDPEDIVVSGMGGRFPECENVMELKEAIMHQKPLIFYNKVRFHKGAAGIPHDSCGSILNLDKMDSEFFSYPYILANRIDPGQRKHLEVVYETMCDAGYNPIEFKRSNVGVYNAALSEDALMLSLNNPQNDLVLGLRTMNANRTSYVFDFIGPSYSVDSACSSSATAFWTAVNDLRANRVTAAIVSGIQLNLSPEFHWQYFDMGVASLAGNSIPFDANSDGMLRCEAITALFLQKAKDARRVYASVSATCFHSSGYYQEGISVPSRFGQLRAFEETLLEAKISTEDIQFVEAHGTGTQVGDPIELNSLSEGYHKGRDEPLYVGSIKSNIGHTEASSGICGYIKAILCFETGYIIPNFQYHVPNPNCPDLVDGKLKVPMDLIPLKASHIPVNSFGLGGTMSTTILKHNPKTYSDTKSQTGKLPRMVFFSGTTKEAVTVVFNYVKENPDLKPEFFALLNKLPYTPAIQKPIRGCAIYEDWANPDVQITKIEQTKRREVWFIMTGMGSQWPGMGLQLMSIEPFANAMRRAAAVVKPLGIDLFDVLRADRDYFNMDRNITPTFVALAAVQVALLDVLRQVGVVPDGMIGHSAGELMCAYADECCTIEEIIMCAYWRGKSIDISNLPEGNMAAVGLSWEEAKRRCPEGVYAACDNANDSVTISGPTHLLEKFTKELKAENIFAKTVNTAGYAFHSKYIYPAGKVMLEELQKIITKPRPRSTKWVSTCYPEEECYLEESLSFSADYFCHNLLSTVRFREAVAKVPKNAITVEIGPHFLLQSLLKRAIGSSASYIGLMKRNDTNNVKYLLESLGKLYMEGANPQIERLYPPVQFPVPRSTPMINNLIRWNHSQSFYVPTHKATTVQYIREVKIDKDESYILDHLIDGRSLFPATGYIFLAWEAFANRLEKNLLETPVLVENFKIYRAVMLSSNSNPKFSVDILDATGSFEVSEGNSLVASGTIKLTKNLAFTEAEPTHTQLEAAVSGKDVYNELKMDGYEYGPAFQNLLEVSIEGTEGFVSWDGRWISFLDTLLLFFGLIENSKNFFLPTGALFFKIDPSVLQTSNSSKKTKRVPVKFNSNTGICRTLGVEIGSLGLDHAPHRGKEMRPILENYTFVPNFSEYVPEKKSQTLLSTYMLQCNKAIDDISKIFKKDFSNSKFPASMCCVNENSNENMTGQNLLGAFREISQIKNMNAERKKDIFTTYFQNMGHDVLNSSLVNEDSLKIMLDVAVENSFRKINAVELNIDFPPVISHIADIVKKYGQGNIKNKTILSSGDLGISEEVLLENNIKFQSTEMFPNFIQHPEDLMIGSFVSGSLNDLSLRIHSLASSIKPSGFIIFFHKERSNPAEKLLASLTGQELRIHSQEVVEKIFTQEKLTILCKVRHELGNSLYLLRPTKSANAPHTVFRIKNSDSYKWVDDLKQLLTETEGTVWIVCENNDSSGIIGMVNCLKQELFGERIRCIFIPERSSNSAPFSFADSSYAPLLRRDLMMNVRLNDTWGSYRHLLIREGKQPQDNDQTILVQGRTGDLSSFEWHSNILKYKQLKGRFQCIAQVYYASLNFKDVMMTTGKIHLGPDEGFGFEFCGRDASGRRVAGMASGGCMASTTLYDERLTFEVPDAWSMEDAATVTTVYFTCYYALLMRAQLQERESILIHSGTGGVGQAAISIALAMNCQVFTTVGSEEKKKYLKKKFPQIKDENIGCSRNISFESMIKNRTNGRGVDVVLNSLADDKLLASVRCVALHGRFVEIGKYDSQLDRPLGMKVLLKNVSVMGVHVDEFSKGKHRSDYEVSALQTCMSLLKKGITDGVVQPLDRTIFSKDQVEEAFRYMAKGIHTGKILLKLRDEEPEKKVISSLPKMRAVPQSYFYEHKVYIIIGGLGGFGIEVAKWILRRGGRHVILTSRYGVRLPYHRLCLRRWEKEGYDVRVSTLNVIKKNEAEKLIQEAMEIGSVGGIFNSAVVLRDAFLESQNCQSYEEVCAPKEKATLNLDEISRKCCPDLDYFVCFSSISCGRGNAGQTNYGYANSAMERICEKRTRAGLHGLAIQWGIIGEVGVVHRHMGDDAKIQGVVAQSVQSCLDTMDTFLTLPHPVVSAHVAADDIKKTTSSDDVLTHVCKVLGVSNIEEINAHRSFGEMGLDSLLGVELKQLLEIACDQTIPFQEIQEMCIQDVRELLERAESERAGSESKEQAALFSTGAIDLPATMVVREPLQPVSVGGEGCPLCLLSVGDRDTVRDFRVLAEMLGRPVFALRWTPDTPTHTIEAATCWFLDVIRAVIKGPFQLAGYGMSGRFALQMALQSSDIKNLILLDGSVQLLKLLNKEESNPQETDTILSFLQQFVPDITKIKMAMCQSYSENLVTSAFNYLSTLSRDAFNIEEAEEAYEMHKKKTSLIMSKMPETKINKDIILLENPNKVFANDVAEELRQFKKVSSGKVQVHRIFDPSELFNSEEMKCVAAVLNSEL